jgi:hypothetical protein
MKPTDALNSIFIGITTLHVSCSLSAHHREFLAVHRYWYIFADFMTVCYQGQDGTPLAQVIFEPNLFPYKYIPTFSTPVILHTYLPMKMEQAGCSETSEYKMEMPGNYLEESIPHSEHGESLK